MKPRKWKTLENERVYRTPIFDLIRRHREHPTRGRRDFYVIDAPAWVNIIPLTPDNRVVLIHQYRHGVEHRTLETPGGMVDAEDANPGAAARREMIEETGYDSAEVIEIGRVHPNPAIQPNWCYSFLARGVKIVGQPPQDSAEETAVVTYPLGEVKELIASGKITHALTIAAFSFFFLYNPPRK